MSSLEKIKMTSETNPEEWPVDGLEKLECCPLCRSSLRSLLHENLEDHLFQCAPGKWTMFMCQACGLAYLDPRPDQLTIGQAYSKYFTHEERQDDDPAESKGSLVSRLKIRVLREYIQLKFGVRPHPLTSFLGYLVYFRPRQRIAFDSAMRHLPRPKMGQRLLDIGCGNGRFLAWARVAGWKCMGTETDPRAADIASARGFEIHRGDIEELISAGLRFHVITISHVIEHVHDPKSLLQAARELLVPGGLLWIETPNIKSHGHDCFGASWRGLEPPRHLQIFDHALLSKLLTQVGFRDIKIAPWQLDWEAVVVTSLELAKLQAQHDADRQEFSEKDEMIGRQHSEKREFITLLANTPAKSIQ